eukprot:1291718-Amphidinium_carterae.2
MGGQWVCKHPSSNGFKEPPSMLQDEHAFQPHAVLNNESYARGKKMTGESLKDRPETVVEGVPPHKETPKLPNHSSLNCPGRPIPPHWNQRSYTWSILKCLQTMHRTTKKILQVLICPTFTPKL